MVEFIWLTWQAKQMVKMIQQNITLYTLKDMLQVWSGSWKWFGIEATEVQNQETIYYLGIPPFRLWMVGLWRMKFFLYPPGGSEARYRLRIACRRGSTSPRSGRFSGSPSQLSVISAQHSSSNLRRRSGLAPNIKIKQTISKWGPLRIYLRFTSANRIPQLVFAGALLKDVWKSHVPGTDVPEEYPKSIDIHLSIILASK